MDNLLELGDSVKFITLWGVLSYFLKIMIELVSERRKNLEEHYNKIILALREWRTAREQSNDNEIIDKIRKLSESIDLAWAYASDEVIKTTNQFIESVKANTPEQDQNYSRIFFEIREDISTPATISKLTSETIIGIIRGLLRGTKKILFWRKNRLTEADYNYFCPVRRTPSQ